MQLFTPTNAWEKTELDGYKDSCFEPIFKAPGREARQMLFGPECIEMWDSVLTKQGDIVAGDEVQEILKNDEVFRQRFCNCSLNNDFKLCIRLSVSICQLGYSLHLYLVNVMYAFPNLTPRVNKFRQCLLEVCSGTVPFHLDP